MRRREHAHPHENGDRWWHVWRCAECRAAHRFDSELRRGLKVLLKDVVPSPEFDARMLALLQMPSDADEDPSKHSRTQPPQVRLLSSRAYRRPALRSLLAAVVAAFVALLNVPSHESSAAPLEEVLAAMKRVKTAHCSGWFVSYEGPGADLPSPPTARMHVEWWYRAPDQFRREMGPEVPQWSFPPGTLVINGEQAVFHNTRDGSPPQLKKRQMRDLSPVDFFSSEGLLGRATKEKHAWIRDEVRELGSETLRVLTVEYEQPGERFTMRFRWVLTVDQETDRILQADWRLEWRDGRRWRTGATETLDRFDYDVPVSDRLFHPEQRKHGTATGG